MNNNETLNDLVAEIAAKAHTKGIDLFDIRYKLDELSKKQRESKIRETVAAHKDIVGKFFVNEDFKPHSGMFPQMCRYYYVISARSHSQYEVEALYFDEHPTYWFNEKTRILGEYDFYSFEVKSISYNLIKSFKEISESEFLAAAKSYFNEMLLMKWPEDHWRWSNKLPNDPEWKQKR